MPYEYPVNWNALILLYKGTRSHLLNKDSKNGHFSTKNGSKWPLTAKIPNFFSCVSSSKNLKFIDSQTLSSDQLCLVLYNCKG